MPKFYVNVRNIEACATVEAETAEEAEVIAIEQGNADWNYDFGQVGRGDVEISEAE